jgi:hypothetical protein
VKQAPVISQVLVAKMKRGAGCRRYSVDYSDKNLP